LEFFRDTVCRNRSILGLSLKGKFFRQSSGGPAPKKNKNNFGRVSHVGHVSRVGRFSRARNSPAKKTAGGARAPPAKSLTMRMAVGLNAEPHSAPWNHECGAAYFGLRHAPELAVGLARCIEPVITMQE
jgi:hypothetical protein